MSNATKNPAGSKPEKPTPDFPLFAHQNGQWAKKIRGKLYYFGKWADPDGAVIAYNRDRDDLLAGRVPQSRTAGGLTVDELVNRFLYYKDQSTQTGELSMRSFSDYRRTCAAIKKHFGACRLVSDLRPDDFAKFRASLAKSLGPVALGNTVQRVRSVFKFSREYGLSDETQFGPAFRKPTRKIIRRHRHEKTRENGQRMFEAGEVRKLLAAADPTMRAMIFLGLNCGFGQSDLGSLRLSSLDLDGGWVDHPRPKTEVPRRVPLWPQTVAALRSAIACRKTPRRTGDENIVFVTERGRRVAYASPKGSPVDNIGHRFGKLQKTVGITRPGRSFYALRHNFETIGGEIRDQVTVDALMGHVDDSMAANYREAIGDERRRAVVDHIRVWLYCVEKADEDDFPKSEKNPAQEFDLF